MPQPWTIVSEADGRFLPSPLTDEERFWQSIEKTDTCWLWAAFLKAGYGRFAVTPQMKVQAHRYAYELLVGPIPAGLELDHLCRVTACVRPDHLEPVTHAENVRRWAATRSLKTHCKYGHEFTPENTRTKIVRGYATRWCRRCELDRCHRYRARQREARNEFLRAVGEVR